MAKAKKRGGKVRRTAKAKKKSASRPSADTPLRREIAEFIDSGHAHISWKKALADVPVSLRGVKPAGSPFTLWQLLEHLRLALWDILEFSRDATHVSPDWPSGYWPSTDAPPSEKAWDTSVRDFENDLNEMKKLVLDSKADLFAKIPHGTGQTMLREALLVADHNSYHIGQFVLLRRLVGAWPAE
jgi:hypothetical protein